MVSSRRIESVDLARGIASLIMIQGHAYDGWVALEYKSTWSYLFTRLLGTLPLPAFLVLSGASIALRLRAAHQKGESVSRVRFGLVKRGLAVLGWGYLTSFVYAWMDGGKGLDLLLRADVLHAIGLGIASISLFCLWETNDSETAAPTRSPLEPSDLRRKALWIAVTVTLLCPIVTSLTLEISGPHAYLVALFSHVSGITLMPVIPLLAWTATGVFCVSGLFASKQPTIPRQAYLKVALVGLAIAASGYWVTQGSLKAIGGTLSRAHVAVIPCVVDGAGRGLFVLGAAAYVSMRFPARIRFHLIKLGRSSLVAYIFHIPFCYGKLAGPLSGSLDMPVATLCVPLLMAMSYGAVIAVETAKQRVRRVLTPQKAHLSR